MLPYTYRTPDDIVGDGFSVPLLRTPVITVGANAHIGPRGDVGIAPYSQIRSRAINRKLNAKRVLSRAILRQHLSNCFYCSS